MWTEEAKQNTIERFVGLTYELLEQKKTFYAGLYYCNDLSEPKTGVLFSIENGVSHFSEQLKQLKNQNKYVAMCAITYTKYPILTIVFCSEDKNINEYFTAFGKKTNPRFRPHRRCRWLFEFKSLQFNPELIRLTNKFFDNIFS